MWTPLSACAVLSLCALAAGAAQIDAPLAARPRLADLSPALDRQLDLVQPSAAASAEQLAASLAARRGLGGHGRR